MAGVTGVAGGGDNVFGGDGCGDKIFGKCWMGKIAGVIARGFLCDTRGFFVIARGFSVIARVFLHDACGFPVVLLFFVMN